MIKIYLSINNNEEVILMPVTPESYKLNDNWNNLEVEGLYQNMNIIKNKGLSTIEISSFFPVRYYPFSLNTTMYGMDYVTKIKAWQDRKVPLRLIILNDDATIKSLAINMAVTIDTFETETKKDGDIYYTLSFKEFKFVEVS